MLARKVKGWRGAAAPPLALLVVASVLAVGAPAEAGRPARAAALRAPLPPPVLVSATSSTNSSSKSVTVRCPTGLRVYGTGAEIIGGLGHVTIDDMIPNLALTDVFVTAFEVGRYPGRWQVRGFAICGRYINNLQRVEFATPNNSAWTKTAVASCPRGTRLYGTGMEITNGLGDVILDDLTPDAGLTNNQVVAFERGPIARRWTLRSYGICADPVRTMVRASASTGYSVFGKSVTARCPAGTFVHGVGGDLTGAGGRVVLDDLRPNPGLRSVTTTGIRSGPYVPPWRLRAFAICTS